MVKIQPAINERIRTLLWRKHWSGNELERRAGLSPGYLSQVLQGKRVPSLGTLDRIEKALGAPILAIAGRLPQFTRSGQSYARRNDPEPLPEEEREWKEVERIMDESLTPSVQRTRPTVLYR